MARAASMLIILGTVISPIVSIVAVLLRFAQAILFLTIGLSILSFVGLILFLISMNGFGNYYKEPAIFRNVLYGFITAIAGGVVLVLIVLAIVFGGINPLFSTPHIAGSPSVASAVLSFFVFLGIVWIGVVVIALVQSIFYKRAFDALAEKSGEGKFKEAGLLMLIGGALTIVLVGGIVFFVGWIFATVGFFSIRTTAPQNIAPSQQKTSSIMIQKRYCSQCGAEINLDSIYCSHCGSKL